MKVRAQMLGRIEDFGEKFSSFLLHKKLDTSSGGHAVISSLQKQI